MDRAGWQRWWTRRGEHELRRILVEEWDPIEVGDVPEAHGEYDNYFGPLVRRLRDGASPADIADYLTRIEEDFMGLSPSPETRERRKVVGARLVSWYAEEMAIEER